MIRTRTHRAAAVAAALLATTLLAAVFVAAWGAERPAAGMDVQPAEPAAATTDSDRAREREEADLLRATQLIEILRAKYDGLDGVTVTIGITPAGEEAVAYYEDDEIVISRDHTVSVQKILAHEIWHIIDWRDNGQLDWGEDLPPANAADYLKG